MNRLGFAHAESRKLPKYMAAKNRFKAGDLVILKSGGPVMTVLGEHRNTRTETLIGYYCQWFAGKKLEKGEFAEASLEPTSKESKQ